MFSMRGIRYKTNGKQQGEEIILVSLHLKIVKYRKAE